MTSSIETACESIHNLGYASDKLRTMPARIVGKGNPKQPLNDGIGAPSDNARQSKEIVARWCNSVVAKLEGPEPHGTSTYWDPSRESNMWTDIGRNRPTEADHCHLMPHAH